jgi:signal transduction histidine kinase
VDDFLGGYATVPVPVLLVTAVSIVVIAAVAIVLSLAARRLRRRSLTAVETERDELELALAEQTARLRIVRELHVMTIPSLSAMIAQAEGARYSAEHDPGATARSAESIADAARAAQADLRRVMTVIQEAHVDDSPLTGLGSIDRVLSTIRARGLVIEAAETGERFALAPGAELAIVRILEESLGNALDHGGVGTRVTVGLDWTQDGLRLQVDDDGFRARARSAGLDPNRLTRESGYVAGEAVGTLTGASGASLTEMRERAGLFGGVFSAYNVPGVGFSVSAVFPALRFHNGVHGVNLDG